MKRRQTDFNFLVGINKTSGMTSHDVVNCVRNITKEGRVGHMGTLDPLATGVMLVGVGSAARLNSYLDKSDKTYRAVFELGAFTNTYDVEGEITEEFDVDKSFLINEFAQNYISKLKGVHLQKPCPFSAIKVNGKPAYKAARKGQEVDLKEREIEIFNAKLLNIKDNSWEVELQVSKGTYIRSIANDIGKDLGCGAFVKSLDRISVGSVALSDCYTLQDFEKHFQHQDFKVLNCANLLGFPIVNATEDMLKRIKNGRNLGMDSSWNMFPGSKISVCDKKLLAIYRADSLIDLNCECKFDGPIDIGM